jgi:hypothetical protein
MNGSPFGWVERSPFMAILYGYFDESGKQSDHPVVSFTGVCAVESKIPAFNDAWNVLLRQYGIRSLHMMKAARLKEKVGDRMRRGQTVKERIEALKPFADCINKYLEYGFIQAWDVKGFQAMSESARKKLGSVDDPYYLAFARGIAELIDYVHDDDKIALVCDDDKTTAWDCYRHYRGMQAADVEIRRKIVSLGFADDEYFPALQAADMLAYLSRLEAKRRFYGDRYDFPALFDYLTSGQSSGGMVWEAMFADEKVIKGLSDVFSRPLKRLK